MGRWTRSWEEAQLLAKKNTHLWEILQKGFIIRVVLKTGLEIEGVLLGQNTKKMGATNNPIIRFYSEITVKQLNGTLTKIDLLDIDQIFSETYPEKIKEYEKAGIIEIVEKTKS